MIGANQCANRFLIGLHYQIGGILVLPGALRAGNFILREHIHPLAAVDGVAIHSCQGVGDALLIAAAVTAILGLTVDDIADDAVDGSILLYQRDIVPSRTTACRDCGGYFMRTRISGVNAMVLIYQRLMSPLLGTEGSGDIYRTVHHLSTLIVQTQHRRTLRNKGLLLHTRLGAQRSGYIVQVPHFIPLVGGKGYVPFCKGRIFLQTRLKLKGVP